MIALVGGIVEHVAQSIETDDELRTFASRQEGGAGELRRLLASIKGGHIDEVWILVCWIGHSETRAIHKACRRRRIRVEMFQGPGQVKKISRR